MDRDFRDKDDDISFSIPKNVETRFELFGEVGVRELLRVVPFFVCSILIVLFLEIPVIPRIAVAVFMSFVGFALCAVPLMEQLTFFDVVKLWNEKRKRQSLYLYRKD